MTIHSTFPPHRSKPLCPDARPTTSCPLPLYLPIVPCPSCRAIQTNLGMALMEACWEFMRA
eukprot:3611962-Alexandrium_andersonii.AAC.1